MTIPSLLLGLIIALLAAAIFHAIRGGNGLRFLLFIGLSLIGFFLAHWLSGLFAWGIFKVGALEIGLGVVGSVFFLILGDWLIRR